MKVEISNDMREHSQQFEHVGVGHHPSVHAGICNSHMCHYVFRFICSWFSQRRHSTMFHRLTWTPPQKWTQTLTSCWQKVALSTCMDVNKCLDLDSPRCYVRENLNLNSFSFKNASLNFTVQLWLPVGFSSRICLWHHFVFLTLNNGIKSVADIIRDRASAGAEVGSLLSPYSRNQEPLYELCSAQVWDSYGWDGPVNQCVQAWS